MFDLKKLIAAVSFVTLGLSASAVMAQNGAPTSNGDLARQQQQQGQDMTSDAELKKFIHASEEVSKIREEYTERFNNAKDQPIAQQLQKEAQDKMLNAVENAGLDTESYNQLAQRVQTSPELQQRLQQLQ
ncbi:MAG TPA: DUF4168 domain-containing protein [Pseudomonas sp.]|jgi:hypothetical protein|uniref:DUF4168 domain-containing protein n=1 Tax=Denitrificimonas caeni TaxID=521720 RepID=UPI0003B6A902|nr:DUF4168 domain-containing protein [Denitrificimonas caeni]HAB92531.1 DUF4168 domain-containing protein [Pseudomonas sp.]HHX04666.1 DUF4168 domain-containing protein [Pseudomonas sp.]